MHYRAQLQTMLVMNSGFNGRLPCFYSFQCMWLIFCLVTSLAFINIVQVPPGTVWWWDHFPVVFGNFWSQKALHHQHWVLQHFLPHCGRRSVNCWCHCRPRGLWVSVSDPDYHCRREHRGHVQFQGPRLDDFSLGNGS